MFYDRRNKNYNNLFYKIKYKYKEKYCLMSYFKNKLLLLTTPLFITIQVLCVCLNTADK